MMEIKETTTRIRFSERPPTLSDDPQHLDVWIIKGKSRLDSIYIFFRFHETLTGGWIKYIQEGIEVRNER